jgi:uncharacterized coiled-coil protein SlyX
LEAGVADRLRKARRIMAVQAQLHRLAEWRLAALVREEGELDASQQQLIGTLNEDAALHGLFVDAMARRLRALARETDRVKAAQEEQSRRLLEEAMRLKRAERMADRIGKEERRAGEKRDLQRLLEGIVKGDASLP